MDNAHARTSHRLSMCNWNVLDVMLRVDSALAPYPLQVLTVKNEAVGPIGLKLLV